MSLNESLRLLLRCIEAQLENGTFRGERIGLALTEFGGAVSGYRKGTLLLFHEGYQPSLVGEVQGPRTLVVESSLSEAALREQRARGSLLTTGGTMVGVPPQRVGEVWGMPEGGGELNAETLAPLLHCRYPEVRLAAIQVLPEFLACRRGRGAKGEEREVSPITMKTRRR